jgi:hypothetical protein
MSERETRIRTAIVVYFPMFIAALSLVTSIYNGYLNSRFVDFIQHNLARGESLRTCKEILEAHAQVELRARILSQVGQRSGASTELTAARNEADTALIKYVSLATYLANLRPEARERYTQLSLALEKVLNDAPQIPEAEVKKRLDQTEQMFSGMNDDCVRIVGQ